MVIARWISSLALTDRRQVVWFSVTPFNRLKGALVELLREIMLGKQQFQVYTTP